MCTASVDSSGHSGAVGLDHREVVWPKASICRPEIILFFCNWILLLSVLLEDWHGLKKESSSLEY